MTILESRKAAAVINGQAINVCNPQDAIARVSARLRAGIGFTFATLNLDHLVKLRADPAFRAAYRRMTLVSADGAPVAALARAQTPDMRRATGADLLRPLCEAAAREKAPVAFFGSKREVLQTACARLRAEIPGLEIVFVESPRFGFDPFSLESEAYGDRIVASGARLCFVCLGAPKQELFADRMAQRHGKIGFVGVGAAVDFIAGAQVRAPRLLRVAGLEWLWRLACEPRRMGRRYTQCAALLARLMIEQRPLAVRPGGEMPLYAPGE